MTLLDSLESLEKSQVFCVQFLGVFFLQFFVNDPGMLRMLHSGMLTYIQIRASVNNMSLLVAACSLLVTT